MSYQSKFENSYQLEIDQTLANCYLTEDFSQVGDMLLLDCICRIETLGENMPAAMLPLFEAEAIKRGLVADIELPTEAELEYYDAQAEAMGVPSKPVAKPTVRMVRITLFVDGNDISGQWEPLKVDTFARQCGTLASLGMAFSVEYKEGAK